MARICELTGARTRVGNMVSHSNVHTKRTFKPNLQEKTYFSDVLNRNVTLRLSTRAIRTVDKHNGLDGYMLQVRNVRVREGFSANATRLRAAIVKKAAKAETAAPAPKAKRKAKAAA